MTSNEGFLAFNLLCYEKETLEKVFAEVRKVKTGSAVYMSGDEDLNKVVILSKSKMGNVDERLSSMEAVLKNFNLNKGLWLTEMKIKEHIIKIQDI
jgi:hypothetical protein